METIRTRQLEEENAKLRAALKPFAEIARAYAESDDKMAERYKKEGRTINDRSDGHRVSISLGDCRRARDAIAKDET